MKNAALFLLLSIIIGSLASCQKQINYNTDIASLNDRLFQLQAKNDSLTQAIVGINTNVQLLNSNFTQLNKVVDSIKGQLVVISNQIATLRSDLLATNANITQIIGQIEELTTQMNTLLSKLNDANMAISLNTGLVAYYPFTGNANDSSIFGNNGRVYGASLTTDRFGVDNSAYNFNGTNYIVVENASQLNFGTGSFSISSWAMCTGSNQWQHILTKGDVPYPTKEFYLRYDNNNIDFTSTLGASESGIYTRSKFQVSNKQNWHSIIVNYNSSTSTSSLYFDGVLIKQAPIISNVSNTTGPMYFGVENPIIQLPSGPQYFTGKIDEIRMYNRPLLQTEISYIASH